MAILAKGEVTITDVYDGSPGVPGAPGGTGPAGISITKVENEYAMNDSTTSAPTTGWSLVAPEWVLGSYIWTRNKVTYSSGNPTYTPAVCIEGQMINTLAQTVTTNTGDISTLQLDLTEATTIDIGGDSIPLKEYSNVLTARQNRLTEKLGIVNLYPGSSKELVETTFTWQSRLGVVPIGGQNPIQEGDTITVSIHVAATAITVVMGVIFTDSIGAETTEYLQTDSEYHEIFPDTEGFMRYTGVVPVGTVTLEAFLEFVYPGPVQSTLSYSQLMVTLGTRVMTWGPYLQDITSTTTTAVQEVVNEALLTTVTNSRLEAEINFITEELKKYMTKTQTDSEIAEALTVFQDYNSWVAAVSTLEAVTGNHTPTIANIVKYFGFGSNWLNIGLSTSSLSVQITNEAVNFLDGSTKIAWITGQQLYIKSVVVKESAEIVGLKFENSEGYVVLTWVG